MGRVQFSLVQTRWDEMRLVMCTLLKQTYKTNSTICPTRSVLHSIAQCLGMWTYFTTERQLTAKMMLEPFGGRGSEAMLIAHNLPGSERQWRTCIKSGTPSVSGGNSSSAYALYFRNSLLSAKSYKTPLFLCLSVCLTACRCVDG